MADLTVDLRTYDIDVSSGCVLSLVARNRVAPAVDKLTDTFSLSLAARVTVGPADTPESLGQIKGE